MSTLKVSEIRNASSATGGLSIAADGVVSGALPYPNRNLLYNGAMQVAQRGTSTASITTTGYYTADRWQHDMAASFGAYTQSVESDAPSGSGLSSSLKVLCTTSDAAPSASDRLRLRTKLEGYDVQRTAKGTSAAKQLSLSFWVKSNTTGTFVTELIDDDNSRNVSAAYSITASATWEKKSITFPADTTGVFDNDNNSSLQIVFWLAAGSGFSSGGSLETNWATPTNANRAVGQTNLAAATNNYWQITGVQLEVGDTATEFEHLPFGVDLARCQRYCYKFGPGGTYAAIGSGRANSTTVCYPFAQLPVTMRTSPTEILVNGNLGLNLVGLSATAVTSLSISAGNTSPTAVGFTANTASVLTAGTHYDLAANNDGTAYVVVGAEL